MRLGRQPWLPRLAPLVVGGDRLLLRLSGGRVALMSSSGLPALSLTVRGRTSGAERTVPLLGIPHEGTWLVAASNWGGTSAPEWARNLRAAGRAVVTVRGSDVPVVAREAAGPERAQLWQVLLRVWPNFEVYAARTDREIPVFVLVPDGPRTRHRRARSARRGGAAARSSAAPLPGGTAED